MLVAVESTHCAFSKPASTFGLPTQHHSTCNNSCHTSSFEHADRVTSDHIYEPFGCRGLSNASACLKFPVLVFWRLEAVGRRGPKASWSKSTLLRDRRRPNPFDRDPRKAQTCSQQSYTRTLITLTLSTVGHSVPLGNKASRDELVYRLVGCLNYHGCDLG